MVKSGKLKSLPNRPRTSHKSFGSPVCVPPAAVIHPAKRIAHIEARRITAAGNRSRLRREAGHVAEQSHIELRFAIPVIGFLNAEIDAAARAKRHGSGLYFRAIGSQREINLRRRCKIYLCRWVHWRSIRLGNHGQRFCVLYDRQKIYSLYRIEGNGCRLCNRWQRLHILRSRQRIKLPYGLRFRWLCRQRRALFVDRIKRRLRERDQNRLGGLRIWRIIINLSHLALSMRKRAAMPLVLPLRLSLFVR